MIKPLRGMKDLLFDDAARFEHIVRTASDIAKRYGYRFIQTPILEETALFKRSVGDSSDIVTKEMYRFTDKGGNDVCMRPEGTAGVVRAFLTAKLDRRPGRYRFFYYGPMFRYERPQKGRLRQFHQFGCESFGEASVYEDFTVIAMIARIFETLGIGYKLKINSLGCPECMPPYRQTLVSYLHEVSESLCEDCNRRIATNPIRVLDCKNATCQEHLGDSPKLVDHLCDTCANDFQTLTKLLDDNNIAYEVDTHLVRGLDYYTKTAFEFVSDALGAQSAIAGGGRYDRLVEYLGGKPVPAVGFALGIERIMELVTLQKPSRKGYYLGAMTPEALPTLLALAERLRRYADVTFEYTSKGFKSHMKGVDKANARYAVLIGETEHQNGTVWLKDIETKKEQSLAIEALETLAKS